MKPQELHVWRDKHGRVTRVEFHNGPQRMEIRATKIVQIDEAAHIPRVEFTVFAKPIYHDDEPEDVRCCAKCESDRLEIVKVSQDYWRKECRACGSTGPFVLPAAASFEEPTPPSAEAKETG